MKRVAVVLALFLSVIVGSCEEQEKAIPIEPVVVASGERARLMQFQKLVVDLRRGQEIGRQKIGYTGLNYRPLVWEQGRATYDDPEVVAAFRKECERANYRVAGDPNMLFDVPSEPEAELLVAACIKDMRMDMQYPFAEPGDVFAASLGDPRQSRGDCAMKVEWQVYSQLQRDVVYTNVTEGENKITKAAITGEMDVFLGAFAMATRNLLSDQRFHDLVTEPTPVIEETPSDLLLLARIPCYNETLTKHVNLVRASAVTVYSRGGHGSGFFIAEEGYLLTNAHVIGEAKIVNVKLVTGREMLGEVLRLNRNRDVALVKVEERGMTPVPIRESVASIGEKVYVVGTPLEDTLDATLTTGIVSAMRSLDQLKYIQSDVTILPGSSGSPLLDENGNCIGVAVSTVSIDGMPSGMNFFIPIAEALKALNVEHGSKKP